ncbi:MAG: hypothetical protein LBU89_14995, partial [Fibromonadaceae bacterium]|nr:hypothetical protein [Fibromonadaceae bacterium]
FVNTLSLWLRLVFTSNIGNLLFLFVTLLDARSGKKNIKNTRALHGSPAKCKAGRVLRIYF